MLSPKRLFLLAALVVAAAYPAMASTILHSAVQSDVIGIVLETPKSELHLGGTLINKARVYGHRSDLRKLLDSSWKDKSLFFNGVNCGCLLEGNVGECTIRESAKVEVGGFGNLPPGKIIIVIDDAGQFADSYKRSHDAKVRWGAEGSQNEKCLTSELCINSKGEISYGLECNGLGFQVSTSGEVKVTVGGVTFPVIKGN
ncbi:MAG: hypothetical protein QOH25_2178 [Acidobacteriota bacterium]|jgi:hypothetical protein|nr:hypothetical protein [Acidobacteriota bacterium]